MSRPRTFPEAFQRTVAAHPDDVALRTPDDSVRLTWRQYGDEVRRIAGGLAALGLRRGDTFAAMLTNRPEFNLTEVAASHLGAATYSIYPTSSPEQIHYLLTHADCRIVVCERQFVDRITAAGAPLAHLLVVEDGDLARLAPAPGFDFEAAWRAVEPDDLLCLIYTSGTTGPPKGVEHTHRGWLRLIDSVATVWPMEAGDTAISYLPSSHSGDRFYRHYYPIVRGGQVTCLADPAQLADVIAALHPTTFAAVPRTWEKLKAAVERQVRADERTAAAFDAGDPAVLESIRARLGFDRLKWALTGTAAIPRHVYAFWQRLGLPLVVGWGMTECGLGTAASPAESEIGTIGRVAPGAEARIAADGELLVRMPWLMRGYRKDPAGTAAAVDPDGWLRTGDLATVDADGTFTIIGRKKELIVNSGGKNMSPSNIEHAITAGSPLIGPVLAFGDDRPYNVALVTLDRDAAAAYAARAGVETDPAALARDEGVLAEIEASVAAGNRRLSRIEQIKKLTVLPTFWDPGGDELTSTMKLKRQPIAAKYAAEIDALYADRAPERATAAIRVIRSQP
ncbi:long-chain fatty acid--CoA ligase [Micromonospora sp. PLK6-60]|uniref:AMP-dependent synthetase/ligase n=1 Tax=Micromonospora sp. PLK6-60 TaxID=2873383 RepID=UPI001CA72BC4|nr:long-chain fatty acid--CoA ligase [Micromonospora sp. PLK6-60]MBY8870745.1 long-chain fatty acid--CoA ligase [Micromonospora sp. PLK6-60]